MGKTMIAKRKELGQDKERRRPEPTVTD